jgi:hypothetical protein
MRWTEDDLLNFQNRVQRPTKIVTSAKANQPTKYGNVRVTDSDGLTHASRKEYRRWCELELRERAGEISNLRRQPVFDLIVNGVLVCRYVADAAYDEGGAVVVEDTKSEATRKNRAYRIKAKLMQACHNIQIREV